MPKRSVSVAGWHLSGHPQSRVEQGAILEVVFNNSMHSFNDELP